LVSALCSLSLFLFGLWFVVLDVRGGMENGRDWALVLGVGESGESGGDCFVPQRLRAAAARA